MAFEGVICGFSVYERGSGKRQEFKLHGSKIKPQNKSCEFTQPLSYNLKLVFALLFLDKIRLFYEICLGVEFVTCGIYQKFQKSTPVLPEHSS